MHSPLPQPPFSWQIPSCGATAPDERLTAGLEGLSARLIRGDCAERELALTRHFLRAVILCQGGELRLSRRALEAFAAEPGELAMTVGPDGMIVVQAT